MSLKLPLPVEGFRLNLTHGSAVFAQLTVVSDNCIAIDHNYARHAGNTA